MRKVNMPVELRDCPSCKKNNWEEIELPHGAPYFRCLDCKEKYPANEIEYYLG